MRAIRAPRTSIVLHVPPGQRVEPLVPNATRRVRFPPPPRNRLGSVLQRVRDMTSADMYEYQTKHVERDRRQLPLRPACEGAAAVGARDRPGLRTPAGCRNARRSTAARPGAAG